MQLNLRNLTRTLGETKYTMDELMILDSGAEISVVKDSSLLTNTSKNTNDILLGAGDEELSVQASGSLCLKFGKKTFRVKALASKDASCNLISLHALENAGIIIDLQHRLLLNKKEQKIGELINHGRYICIPLKLVTKSLQINRVNNVSTKLSMAFIHRLFGHINIRTIKETIQKQLIKNINIADIDWSNIDKFQCTDCMKGKATKHKHIVGSRLKYQSNYGPFEYIHSDLFGPVTGVSAVFPAYFISFTDEATRFRWVYPLKTKSADAIYNTFDHLIRQIHTQFKIKVLSFHMDRGSEYTNSDIRELFQEHGIIPIYSSTTDSSSNGIAERSNLTFLNDCRTLLNATHLSNNLWFHAVEFATIMRNAFINSTNKISPRGKAGLAGLDASTILPFGQEVVVHNHKVKNKLHPRGITGYALSPSKESHGYLIYIPSNKTIIDTSNYSLVKHSKNYTSTDSSIFDELISTYGYENDISDITANTQDVITHDANASTNDTKTGMGGNNTPSHIESVTIDDNPSDTEDDIPLDALDDIVTDKRPPIEKDTSTLTAAKDDSLNTTIADSSTLIEDHISNKHETISADEITDTQKSQILPGLGGTKHIDKIAKKMNNSLSIYQNPKKRNRQDLNDPNRNNKVNDQHKKYKKSVNYVKAVKHVMQTKQINPALNYSDAIINNKSQQERKEYKIAYDKEINQLMKMGTWDTSRLYDAKDIPPNKIINSMFIFTTKRDGTRKCRFVARGDQQHPSTYDQDAISNTVHHYALMTTLALALDNNKFVTQLDISSAYLYADLSEELYIRTPPHMSKKGKVMRLNKSLYGLKQSGANWYKTIQEYLVNECNLKEVKGWSCVFKNKDLTVCLFVDDMVVTSSDINKTNNFINKLKKIFDTKIVNDGKLDNQGYAYYDILGLEIQYKLGSDMEIGMEKSLESKLTSLDVPLNHSGKLLQAPAPPGTIITKCKHETTEEQYKKDVKWLQKIIGLASYVAYKYRFDILYYVNTLAQHTLFPSEQVKRLTRCMVQYLWDTKNKKLKWHKSANNKNSVQAITDAAFANLDGYGSQIGYFIKLNDKIIGGASSRAKLTCTSSTESEIYAVSKAIPMVNSLGLLIPNISTNPVTLEINCDSMSTINIAKSDDDKKFRNRFFGTKAMRMRDEIKYFNLRIEYINTESNTADILTKSLSYRRFVKLTSDWIE